MRSVNIHEAKTHFSRLVDEVAAGETIIIAKAGRPAAQLTPLPPALPSTKSLIGFLSGRGIVPDHFDRLGEDEIAAAFEGEE
ncbi:type II toxin-antitoxin system prevent-host-death family antitoxin [soil metagenome]